MSENIKSIVNQNKVIDINKVVSIIVNRWYIVILTITVSIVMGYLKLRYTVPIFETDLTLKMEDEKPNSIGDIFKFGRTTGKLENFLKTESEIIKSRSFAERTLKELNYQVSYYKSGKILTQQIYPNKFFEIQIVKNPDNVIGKVLQIEFLNFKKFKVAQISGKEFYVGDTLFYNGSLLKVHLLNQFKHFINLPITCVFNDYKILSHSFSGALSIENKKGTSILELSFTSPMPELAADYLNCIVKVYIKETVNNKSLAAAQTLNFIQDQLDELSVKVKRSESDLIDLKAKNKGISPETMGSREYSRLIELETQNSIMQLKLKLLETLEKNVREAKDKSVAFINIDNEDASNLPELFGVLNGFLIDRLNLKSQNTPFSPRLMDIENKIRELKLAILESLKTIKNKTLAKIDFNNNIIGESNSVLMSVPEKQRSIINVQRESTVNEKVYSYLLEKRLETMIAKSSITSNASVIDAAEVPTNPIYPIKDRILSFAFLIGLSIGLVIIFGSRAINQKIPDKETIENNSKTPVIGVIKKQVTNDNPESQYDIYTLKNPKSMFSESIRGIRTGINFLLKNEVNKIICVTSTVSGEGKTFCTINIAASMSLIDKRVLVIGCDLRRPKLHLSFPGMTNDKGLSTYLIGKHSLSEIIQNVAHENLFVITAGPTAPNPSELLQSDKMINLLGELRQKYDYILLDSSPVGLVSDALVLMKHADVNLYIFRAMYSRKDFVMIPDSLLDDSSNNIKNIYSILNSYDQTGMAYSSIYRTSYNNYHGGGYYYYGGYYGRASYGYYGKNYYSSYYSGYYADEELNPKNRFLKKIKRFFLPKDKINKT